MSNRKNLSDNIGVAPQALAQFEELLKSMNEHLYNMTKGIVLEEDCSFVEEELSKKFMEPLSIKDYHYNHLPQEFLIRADYLRKDFDEQIKKLVSHFRLLKEDQIAYNDRKMDVLKQEVHRYKNEVANMKTGSDKLQSLCKTYEDTIVNLRAEHQSQLEKYH